VPACGWGTAPQLAVYSSPDLVAWTFRGHLFNASVPADKSFTKWIPTALVSDGQVVLWFGSGAWAIATSRDGVSFDLVSRFETSRLGGSTVGTGVFLDDDGVGYVAFAALSTGGALGGGHLVSIERLAPDLLSSSKENVTGFFPLDYVESPALFKRADTYYLLTGSCCCACRGGSGGLVPWPPQGSWLVCHAAGARRPQHRPPE
jgi:beta-xylosidase